MFEQQAGPAGLVDRITASARTENRAAAAGLLAIGELFGYRLAQGEETEDWAIDTIAAVAAEVGAALRIGQGLAAGRVHYARAMRERLPRVGAVFAAGDIDFRLFATIVYRTDLITDADILAAVDGQLAVAVARWPSMSRSRVAGAVDRIVARVDADAVRRRREERPGREVEFDEGVGGLSQLRGYVLTPDAHALDQRLDKLADTVCAEDPRSRAERRADALGALAGGADRLGCRCGRADCPAGGRAGAPAVVIHVLAEQPTLHGDGAPGSQVCADGLISPDLVAELAATAKLVPLVHPGDAAPEPGYVPSMALADFVRCRDLTCRWPGCERPSFDCELDHTIPYAQGGPTHAANLKCYCKTHHLVKTFLGWTEKQLPDGTLILTSPSGHTYVTTPGSALLFPSLARAVGGCPAPEIDIPAQDYCASRTAMMPRRRRTRSQDRAYRVAAERRKNREARVAGKSESHFGPAPPAYDDDPPPF
ncbi:HNH endonuclease signature motif containing protein [Mycobacterium sp. Lab-001]|uniref:HNH endonuclease signature motif containing protein n=1 Tax=Mycobacterium sp. Lab-001 TaxID=3410136 RepID=UPI003D17AC3A